MSDSVSVDRTSLSLSALSIADVVSGTYLLQKDGLGRPATMQRLTSMPDSADVHGTEYIAAAKEESSFVLKVIVQASTSSALDTAITALQDALSQFAYDITVTVGGVAKVWHASPASWSFGDGYVVDAMVLQHFELMTFTIPVYPIPS